MVSVRKAVPALWPVLALMLNAFVWGISWWPFRFLQSHGLHPLWSTALIYVLSLACLLALRPRALRSFAGQPMLWLLVVASGLTNVGFNWAVTVGDVVRVVLLFYLMPLWAVLLARWLLGERITRAASLRILLALLGAAIVLWPTSGSGAPGWQQLPIPRSLPDWLGVVGGFSFALNNVMLRREAHRPAEDRALAMFIGGVLVPGALATGLAWQGRVPWPPAVAPAWLGLAAGLSVLFLLSNLALQYGASRLPANVTSVVMVSEVVVASGSAVALGAGSLSAPLLVGGTLIVLAALLAAAKGSGAH